MNVNFMRMDSVSIIVPAYNEEETTPTLMSIIDRTFQEHGIDGEVIFIDDGSTDGTGDLADKLAKKYDFMKVKHHIRNLGLTRAIETGFGNATGDIVVIIPADLQSDPEEDLPKLLEKMEEGYDAVFGWRQGRKGSRIYVSKIYNYLSRILFGISIHDQNWIKAIRKNAITDMDLRSDWHRYLAIIAHYKGYKIAEVKVREHPRKFGKSKFGISRIVFGVFDLISIKLLQSFEEKPMMIFGSIGGAMMSIGVLFGGYLVYLRLLGETIGDRPLLFLVVLLILVGILLFTLGFIAELIVSLREDVRKTRLELAR